MRRSKLICATMLAFSTAAPGGSALAATGEHNNAAGAATVLAAKVSPGQAIATAEQQAGGRVVKLDVEEEKGVHLYEIKTISGDRVLNVFVDTATGKVLFQVHVAQGKSIQEVMIDPEAASARDRLTTSCVIRSRPLSHG